MPIVAGPIVPNSTAFPSVVDQYLGGGWRAVADQATRLAIPAGRRLEGMQVYSLAEGREYQLIGGITNSDWVAVPSGAVGEVASGTATPEGNVTGEVLGQIYSQVASLGGGGAFVRFWVFNGTVGTNTGWV